MISERCLAEQNRSELVDILKKYREEEEKNGNPRGNRTLSCSGESVGSVRCVILGSLGVTAFERSFLNFVMYVTIVIATFELYLGYLRGSNFGRLFVS